MLWNIETLGNFNLRHLAAALQKWMRRTTEVHIRAELLPRLLESKDLEIRAFAEDLERSTFLDWEIFIERALGQDKVDSQFLVTTRDDLARPNLQSPMPVKAVFENIRSALNMGNMIRSAEAFWLEGLVRTGYTPGPENPKVKKSSLGSESRIPHDSFATTSQAISSLRATGFTVYALETSEKAPSLMEVELKFPAAFLFGNEQFGLSHEGLSQADQLITVPMYGAKNSLNVSVCAGIVFYEARRQWRS